MKSAKWYLTKEIFKQRIKIFFLKVESFIFNVRFLQLLLCFAVTLPIVAILSYFTNLDKLNFGWHVYICVSIPIVYYYFTDAITKYFIESFLIKRKMKKQIRELLNSRN